jgi:hypothetical protein
VSPTHATPETMARTSLLPNLPNGALPEGEFHRLDSKANCRRNNPACIQDIVSWSIEADSIVSLGS